MATPPDMDRPLGGAISARNPYPKNRATPPTPTAAPLPGGSMTSASHPRMALMPNFLLEIEQEEYYPVRTWEFQGMAKPIAKAIRIPYIYSDENGNWVRAHILVGFEGSGSD
jgi:hypothetical protein